MKNEMQRANEAMKMVVFVVVPLVPVIKFTMNRNFTWAWAWEIVAVSVFVNSLPRIYDMKGTKVMMKVATFTGVVGTCLVMVVRTIVVTSVSYDFDYGAYWLGLMSWAMLGTASAFILVYEAKKVCTKQQPAKN